MTSEIMEENDSKLPYMSLNSNNEIQMENIQKIKLYFFPIQIQQT